MASVTARQLEYAGRSTLARNHDSGWMEAALGPAVAEPPTLWKGFAFQWINPKAGVFGLAVVRTFVPAHVHPLVGGPIVPAAPLVPASISPPHRAGETGASTREPG